MLISMFIHPQVGNGMFKLGLGGHTGTQTAFIQKFLICNIYLSFSLNIF